MFFQSPFPKVSRPLRKAACSFCDHGDALFLMIDRSRASFSEDIFKPNLKMDDLKAVMQIIDEHSNVIPEGAYLNLCQKMRKLYTNREKAMTLFDYDEPIVSLHANPDERNDVDEYFERVYHAAAITNDIEFFENQLTYLMNLKNEVEPMKRVSKYTKMFCVRHYCRIHGIKIDEYNAVALKNYCQANNVQIGKRGKISIRLSLGCVARTKWSKTGLDVAWVNT